MPEAKRPVLRVVHGGRAPSQEPKGPCLTIADVAKACGLPQPVIAQLVPRTWTAHGWMYTHAQLEEAVQVAHTMRSGAPGDAE